jgi:hypothetical protein
LTAADLLAALEPVVAAFEALSIRYYVGGSVASSTHGVPRSSVDADIVADLHDGDVTPFLRLLAGAYYADESRIRTAIQSRRTFNLIHLSSMFKVDVFVMKARPFDREAMGRARSLPLAVAPGARPFAVASVEDTIIAKLEWFRAGGETSERQWSDVVGLLRLHAQQIDDAYATRWAGALGVDDLLQRALLNAQAAP